MYPYVFVVVSFLQLFQQCILNDIFVQRNIIQVLILVFNTSSSLLLLFLLLLLLRFLSQMNPV
jgi:hypothetical protein